jgi:hypothetical protein
LSGLVPAQNVAPWVLLQTAVGGTLAANQPYGAGVQLSLDGTNTFEQTTHQSATGVPSNPVHYASTDAPNVGQTIYYRICAPYMTAVGASLSVRGYRVANGG